jgi:recombination protein RecT
LNDQALATREAHPLVVLRGELEQRASEFKSVLPAHIPPDRFQRTVLTAVQANPDLLAADRRSFITSCFKAAQDGLLPDGREAALVVYSVRKKVDGNWVSVKTVQYLPMVYGLRKKILQSAEVKDIFCAVVYRQEIEGENPRFIYEEGTARTLRHKPILAPDFDPSDDDIALAYSVATFADGSHSFEVMRRSEINKVRQASQTGATGRTVQHGADKGKPIEPKGPWVDWFSEMAKKSVLRRHSKSLPMSGDVLIDLEGAEQEGALRASAAALSAPGGQPEALPPPEELPAHDEATGELQDEGAQAATQPEPDAKPEKPARKAKAKQDAPQAAVENESGNASASPATAEAGDESSNSDDGQTSSTSTNATTAASPSEEAPIRTDQVGITETPGEQAADDVLRQFCKAENIIDLQRSFIAFEPHLAALEPEVSAQVIKEYNSARIRLGGKPVDFGAGR